MPFWFRAAAIYLGLYFLIIVFTFISEVTYRKRSILDVRRDWKRIMIKTSIGFAVFLVASIIWSFFDLKGELR